jgi:hypothetical protein
MTIITCSVDFLFERKRKIKQTYLLSWFMSIIRQFFFIKLSCLLCWLKDIHPLFHYSIFVAVLSFSLLFLNWRVLSFESTCDFHIFFLVPLHDFHVYKRERERLCAYVCCRLFAQLHLFVLRRNVFIFVLSLKKTRKESEEKRCKKTYRIFVDFLFLFFFFFFFEICFSVFNFDRKKTHIGIGT